MNEAAEAANHLSAILVLWFWWAFLSFLDVAMRKRAADEAKQQAAAATSTDDTLPATGDERFVGFLRFDPAFSLEAFLDGARTAYEMILEAYAAADIEALKPLLSREVLAAFADACADRARRGETVEFTLIGIDSVEVAGVGLNANAMEVTLCFKAQMVWTERAADGTVVNAPLGVTAVDENWTFSRPIPIIDNAWTVVATGA